MRGKQDRPPPAYTEYAANMLSDASFRAASLSARGLLYQLRLECWANVGCVPSDPVSLCKYLGISKEEFNLSYPQIAKYFRIDGGFLRCPELDSYRAYLEDITRRKSDGGKKGAALTNAGKLRVSRDSLDQYNSDQVISNQNNSFTKKGKQDPDDDWISDYERG